MLLLLALLAAPPTIQAVRTAQPPVLDGKLGDPVWQTAPPFEALQQKFPFEGTSPSERTTVRVLYDDQAIYVAFDCEQQKVPLVQRLTRRDRWPESDYVLVDLDPDLDGQSAYHFQVNSAGVLLDLLHFDDTEKSYEWDEHWEAETAPTPRGWSAEFRIPLGILRYPDAPVQEWGYHIERGIYALQEIAESPLLSRAGAGNVSRYGRMVGFRNLRHVDHPELKPFVLGRVTHRDATAETIGQGFEVGGSAGLDLKWNLGRQLTLDATFNPDFAQVEADQVILNLTNFETFYPEKRPFFLAGFDLFQTPMQLLYTRRIGRAPPAPELLSDPAPGERLVENPSPSAIYGAAKLAGRITERTAIGAFSAWTGGNDVTVERADRTRIDRVAEPPSLFNVLRLRRDLSDKSFVGLMATTTLRLEDEARYPTQPGGPTLLCPRGETPAPGSRCFHDAYTGGIDARWRSRGGDYLVFGQLIGSAIVGGPPRRLRDGTVIAAGDVAPGGVLTLMKEGGSRFTGEISYDFWGRKLDYDDLGFMTRQNLHHVYTALEYRTLDPWRRTLETHTRLEYFDRWNFDGLSLGPRGVQMNTLITFSNFWSLWLEVPWYAGHFDDREVGDGTALERTDRFGANFTLKTDPRRTFSASLNSETFYLPGGVSLSFDLGLILRSSRIELELLPSAFYTSGEPRYVGRGAQPGELLFGRQQAKSVGTTLRATYTFTPRLTLQSYAQLFLSSRHYEEFLSFQATPTGPRPAIALADLTPATAPGYNPDRLTSALNLNVVLRWEYRLGSTLFLVYTRSQAPYAILPPGQRGGLDLMTTLRAPAADVFLVKLSYWLG